MAFSVLCTFVLLISFLQPQFGADAKKQPRKENYAQPAQNVALHGITTQSSTNAYYGSPQNANDGSLANNYLRSQCSYTKKDSEPWWMVDLKQRHNIFSVAITNRVLECCKERIFGAEVRIGNDPTKGGTLNPRCGVISSMDSGETISFSCQGMIGQYVTVTIPGREEHLVLCEVQVFGVPSSGSDVAEAETPIIFMTPNGAPNVARNGISQQSSLYNMYGESKHAIDGSLSSNYLFIECTGTAEQADPWWMVDLKNSYKIFTVAVTNRGDCCAHRINGAQIRIGNSPHHGGSENPICAVIESMDNGETLAFECNGMEGQYVTVFLPGNNKSISVCEVQVFGLPSDDSDKETSPSYTFDDAFDFYKDIITLFDSEEEIYSSIDTESLEDVSIKSDLTAEAENLAFRGVTSQSSTYDKFGNSENAIDGSKNTRYMASHCSHTDLEIEPWWRVDLIDTYNVTTVKITNRGDCCNKRIKGAEIRIGNSPEKGGTKNQRCAKIVSMDLGEEESYDCNMVGRYVTVTIPGRAEYLTLCEVKVYGHNVSDNYTIGPVIPEPEDSDEAHAAAELHKILELSNAAPNIALRGVTHQSSTDGDGLSENSIDGSLRNLLPDTQCSKTNKELGPWWTLDLKSEYKVFSIAITNRGDCCAQELDGAEIHVGKSAAGLSKNLICGTVSSIGLGETYSFNCNGMEGRFVNIFIPDKVISLTLCEVQVFGLPVGTQSGVWNGDLEVQKQYHGDFYEQWNQTKNMAPQGTPTLSSNYGNKQSLGTANDGSLSSNYLAQQCIHTKNTLQPWWKLDLKSRMRVHSIALTNRGDCCRERINGAEIRIGDSKENGGVSNPRCGVIFKMGYGETISINCKGLEGRYVTVTIPDKSEYLTLCEVQVFADPLEKPEEVEATANPNGDKKPFDSLENLSGKSIIFPGESDNSYVQLFSEKSKNLKAFTLCMKISLNVPENRETILFSYHTLFYEELNLWVENDGSIGFYMDTDGVMFPPIDINKEWNHLCLTWESKHGRSELWLNGKRSGIRFFKKKHTIRSFGIFMLGQDQDIHGGAFDKHQSFVGKIKDLYMWDSVLSLKNLRKLFKNKEIERGTIFDWSLLAHLPIGNVTIA